MTKRQYRISTESNWQSMFGQALLAITNVSGSGRKLTLRTLEVQINSVAGANAAVLAPVTNATLFQCLSADGENLNSRSVKLDSSFVLPPTVVVRKNGSGNSFTSILRSVVALRSGAAAGTQNTLNNQKSWGSFSKRSRSSLVYSAPSVSTFGVEPITVPQNTAIVLIPKVIQNSCPLRVHAVVSVNGKTVVWEYVTTTKAGQSIFSLENTGANVVRLLSLGIQEVGTTDTPYLRLVPIGQVYNSDLIDSSKRVSTISPMDSTYPSLDACQVFTDIGFVPFGVPENYMTDTTSGSPRGLNYLHTKDFNGPALRIFFPELEFNKPGGTNEDMLGHGYGHLNSDIGVLKSGIVINPGEGLAIVASAETAVAIQAAFSGWPSLTFNAQIDSEPQYNSYLTLTGLKTGSDIVILYPGTTNVIASVDSNVGSTYSLNYDPDLYTVVDVVVYLNGYVPLAIRNLDLGITGATIPIAQVQDRNFI